MELYINVTIKLLLAIILGGLVGYEREHKARPAGLRTHILVCVGAALVQIISIDFYGVKGAGLGDPMRLGAQVISGIGFLGAGTIIKEGANIRGLTTAASIWAVACIGLAAGSGLYFEAAVSTILIYASLRGFKVVEDKILKEKRQAAIEIIIQNAPGKIGEIGTTLGNMGISITDVLIEDLKNGLIRIEIILKTNYDTENERIIESLMKIEGSKEIKFL